MAAPGLMTLVGGLTTHFGFESSWFKAFSGSAADIMSGEYRLCWCQASSRPCSYPEDFNFDVGKLQIVAAAYVGATKGHEGL